MHAHDLAAASWFSMGTDVSVLAPPDRLTDATNAVHALFTEWDRRLSRFRFDSELSALNRAAGTPFRASSVLFETVSAALTAARATDGLFDPTVGGRLVALGYDATFDALPADRHAAPLPDWPMSAWRDISLDGASQSITLPRGVTIDLGGIAKGMAVDAAVAAATDEGITPIAVNAGGDLAVSGAIDGGWPIALDDAGRSVLLHDGGLATSSVLRRRWQLNGEPMHHLLDPRSGLPSGSDLVSASVAAPTCRAAEVAAKAALLLGSDRGAAWLAARRLTGVLVLESGSVIDVGERREAA
ncbi:MAG TPA: FAD:protein FMN transferase [Candidatus Limnocylindria bacterium]|nr:FAD:protein FMN transferase [Candidatus Limnocylindria bacterium]